MVSLPMGSTSCESCRGRGKTDDDTTCPSCGGTGLVPVKPIKQKVERRRTPRYRTTLPVAIRNRENGDLEGQSTAISEGGISVTLPGPVPVGSVVLLQFSLPTHPTQFRLWAVVRHLIGLHHGLEFVSLTEGERLSLRQFCNELALELSAGERNSPK